MIPINKIMFLEALKLGTLLCIVTTYCLSFHLCWIVVIHNFGVYYIGDLWVVKQLILLAASSGYGLLVQQDQQCITITWHCYNIINYQQPVTVLQCLKLPGNWLFVQQLILPNCREHMTVSPIFWPFLRGIQWSPVCSPINNQWCGKSSHVMTSYHGLLVQQKLTMFGIIV